MLISKLDAVILQFEFKHVHRDSLKVFENSRIRRLSALDVNV